MKAKKSLLLFSAGMLTMSTLLAGCSGTDSNDGGTKAADTEQSGSDQKPVTITAWADYTPPTGSEGIATYNDHLVWKEIPKRTPITVKWETTTTTSGDEWKTKLGLITASGKMPDLIGHVDPLLAEQYGRQGAFQPLEDLIKQHAPNLQKILDSNPAVKGQITSPDGHIYFFPRLLLDTKVQAYAGYMIRGDWLQKVGMKAPDTTDELYQVLKAFKEKDPNGNGKADEIPFTSDPRPIIWAFGVGSRGTASQDDFFVEDGKIKYGPTDPRYQEALKFLNKLFSEGLLDNEYEGQKNDARDARVMQELSGFMFGSNAGFLTRYNKLLQGAGKNTGFIAMTPPKGPTGERNIIGKHAEIDPGMGAAISSTSKNAADVTKLIDYFYSKEGTMLLDFGIEGDTYAMKDGMPVYTDKVLNHPKLDVLNYINSYVGYVSGFPAVLMPEHYLATLSEEGRKGNELATANAGKKKAPNLRFTAEETGEITQLLRDINTFVDENMNAFISGRKPFTEYAGFQQGLKKIGVDRLIEIYNKAYERYNAAGKK